MCKLSLIVNNRAAHLQGVKHVHKYLQCPGFTLLSYKFKAFFTKKNSKKGIFNNFKKIGSMELSAWLTLLNIKIHSVLIAKCF